MLTHLTPSPSTVSSRSVPASRAEVIYPDSDGKPMADNTRQFEVIVTLQGGLAMMFADRPDVFVAGDLLWYPVEGNNQIRAAPDVMVAFGRPPGYRGSYQQWREEGIAPQVAFEVLSPGNRSAEMIRKFDFYQHHGVEEYYVYDPDRGVLKGWLRQAGRLTPIPGMEGWVSPRLGIRFGLEGDDLVVQRPDGRCFETFVETGKRSERSELRVEAECQRAEAESRRAETESRRAEAESRRASESEQRFQRLAERLRVLGFDPDAIG